MRILFIANRPDIFSGGQISLLELLSRVDRSRFEPILLCPGEGSLAEKAKAMGITVHLWEMPTARTLNIIRTAQKINELRSIIRKCSADIVHTNGSRAQFYASLAVKGTKALLIWHVRESVRDILLYDRFLAGSADRIICVSQTVKDKRFGHYPGISSKIDVIYNGADTHEFVMDEQKRKTVRKELGIGSDKTLLGIIGLLVPLKGHLFLFKAMKKVIEKYPDVRLLVMGKAVDEPYAAELKEEAWEMEEEKNVIFLEPSDDIKAVLSALDIFILPSRREGFSRVLLEAMACSLPVIATDVSGNNEAIVDG
ncbi:MAG: glycosyltransferase family 4 protein, partial [Candidatus Omnitrophota bacterium]